MKYQCAIFRNVNMNYETVWSSPADKHDPAWKPYGDAHIRISDWVEVEFRELPRPDQVAAEVAILDADERELVEKFRERLAAIRDRKQKLLALTHESTHELEPAL